MDFSRVATHPLRFLLPAFLALCAPGQTLRAQRHPTEITPVESTLPPYRLSGQLNVKHGSKGYFGTTTFIRRYTGVTAGHLLYDSKTGLSTDLYDLPALYDDDPTPINVSSFAVLSGYQSAVQGGDETNAAFDQDMGYVLFAEPSPGNEWASFGVNTDALTTEDNFLVLGYAAESFTGQELAEVSVRQSYYELTAPGLYENTDYYTESGMSGGPLYVFLESGLQMAAVNVAGTSSPHPAYSDARVITAAELSLFTEAEYASGLIVSGVIRGPASVAPGRSGKYKVGVVFRDGLKQGTAALPGRYDELVLQPVGPGHSKVKVDKLTTGKFRVTFSDHLASGEAVTLQLVRSTAAPTQSPLQTMTVTVQ